MRAGRLSRFSTSTSTASLLALATLALGGVHANSQEYQFSGRVVSVGTGANKQLSVGDRFSGSFATDSNASVSYTGNNYRHYNSGVSTFTINFSNGKKFSATNSVFTLDSSQSLAIRNPNYKVYDVDFVMVSANPTFSNNFSFGNAQTIRSADFDKSSKKDLKLASVVATFNNLPGNYFKTKIPSMQTINPSAFTHNTITLTWLDPSQQSILQAGARYTQVELVVDSFTRGGNSGGGNSGGGNANRAPTLNNVSNRTVTEGSSLSFNLSASDPDGDQLTYSMSGAPSGAILVGNKFSYSPSYNVVTSGGSRSFTVKFTVSDGRGGSASKNMTLTVNNKNRAPSINSISAKTVTEGGQLRFGIAASDPDGDSLTYSLSGAPAGASMSGNTFTYSPQAGTVNSGNSRNFQVKVVVKDPSGATASRTFSLRVNKKASAPPPAPAPNPVPDEGDDRPTGDFTSVGQTNEFKVETFNDNNRVNGRQEGLPQGLDGNKNTKNLHWAPEAFYRITPKVSGKLTAIKFMTANDAPDRDPKRLRIDGVNNAITVNPPKGRFANYSFNLPNGGLTIKEGEAIYMSIEAVGDLLLQYAEMSFEVQESVIETGDFTSVYETSRFVIETSNDNNRDNGFLESIAQAFDGRTNTKVLHWSDQAVYRITPKANGVLKSFAFVTANDHAQRDPAVLQIAGGPKLSVSAPSQRFKSFEAKLPGNGLQLKKGVPIVVTIQAKGNEYLQFAELDLKAQF